MDDRTLARRAVDRASKSIEVDPVTGCWCWTASKDRKGYGLLRAGRKTRIAHRWMFEQVVGAIPDGLTLDHLCRNHACVNPAHLEPVTNRENIRRGVVPTANREWCKNGVHLLAVAGVYVDSAGSERCRECRLESKRRYERRKAA